jgi:glutathione S-transferase
VFDYLEKSLGGHSYLVAGAFSIADIAVATMLVNYDHCGEKLDAGRWPGLARYMEAMHARPSFKACIEEERPIVERARAA